MKREILSLALALIFVFALVPFVPSIAAVPEGSIIRDPAFYAAVLAEIDKPDGYVITAADVSGITSLYVSGLDICDLTVIEHFTALETLWCERNQLTSLDVSKNTALKKLNCSSNQLTELDVSKNTALIYLDCDGNQLPELDVSKNAELTYLYCDGNQLTELDVGQNTALMTLYCPDNQLTELDVSKNAELTSLYCDDNQLTELDVGQNTALMTLRCSSNQLAALNVSKNTALVALNCGYNQMAKLDVSKNTELEALICYFNQLTELDVSKNTDLVWLFFHHNQLTELDVSKNTALEMLWCSDNQLTELDVSKNTALEMLWCDSNQLTSLNVTGLPLTRLNCSYNYMADYSAVTGFTGTWDDDDFIFDPQRIPDPLDTASDWARPNITAAIEKGFVPKDIQDNYQNDITRQEFCRMAVMWLEYKLGKGIDAIVAEKGMPERMAHTFSDTSDPNILAAYRLGVTSGTVAPTADKPGLFTPNGTFDRQSAATMLRSACKVAGFEVDGWPDAGFADMGKVADWAKPGVNFVRANGIMNGDGTNFNPGELYSRQHSIITFNNIK